MFPAREWTRPALALLALLFCGACTSKDGAEDVNAGGKGAGGGSAGAGGSSKAGAGSGGTGVSGTGSPGGSAGSGGAGPGGAGGGGGAATAGTSGGAGSSATGGAGSAGGGAGGAGTTGVGGSGAGGGGSGGTSGSSGGPPTGPVSLTIFDEVVFYDGYANLSGEPVPDGVQRLRNDIVTHKLTDAELDSIQNTLDVEVVIGALCDNYDRIGSVGLALVPKGETSYEPDDVEHIEVGRYITPFMDKNRQPDEVSYEYEAHHLVPVLHDVELRAEFDLWLELELFGVPYAANDEVQGCANRSDVFRGTLILDSDSSAAAPAFDELIPLAYKETFNDYQQGASDGIGMTRKTIEYELDGDTADTQLVLITSNHGANSGGEEYIRRDHFVYVDDELKLMYKPGRTSCEPFRQANTQGNGIYGTSPRSDSEWQSFSNWCPGDVIDTRIIPLGPQDAGTHEFVIEVPDAVFTGDEGNFPISLFVQARH
ncbi:MAG TPA: peptide-N-glycosidase F-related protein [Polyangiaceae bacterium]